MFTSYKITCLQVTLCEIVNTCMQITCQEKGGVLMSNKVTTVSRAINGIGLNGDEWLLDDDGDVITFESEIAAREYLKENGISDKEIESYNFHEEGR